MSGGSGSEVRLLRKSEGGKLVEGDLSAEAVIPPRKVGEEEKAGRGGGAREESVQGETRQKLAAMPLAGSALFALLPGFGSWLREEKDCCVGSAVTSSSSLSVCRSCVTSDTSVS
jgi:hypothetical protein